MRWSKQGKWKKRKQLYKTPLSIGCYRTAIQGLVTGKNVHMFLKTGLPMLTFYFKTEQCKYSMVPGHTGMDWFNPLLTVHISLNWNPSSGWATNCLTISSLNLPKLQIPPYLSQRVFTFLTQNRTVPLEEDNHHKYLALPSGNIQESKKLQANILKAQEEAEPLGGLSHFCNLVAHYTSGLST